MLPGKLFRYGSNKMVAFRASNPHESESPKNKKPFVAVLVSGLQDGIYSLDVTDTLVEELSRVNIELVMPVLRTSWSGWGMGSLAGDAEDLTELIDELQKEEDGSVDIILMGFSTGAQSVLRFMSERNSARKLVKAVILLSPVSDAEWFHNMNNELRVGLYDKYETEARKMKPEEILPERLFGKFACSSYRYLSLYSKGGDDDYFSSYFSDDELRSRLGHVDVPCLIIQAIRDEYVPGHVDTKELNKRLTSALPKGRSESVNSRHDFKGNGTLVALHICTFIIQRVAGSW